MQNMDIQTLYIRTARGQNALIDKYVTLPHSLKRALIIVDGQRNVGELLAMAPRYDDLNQSLQTLHAEGFIEAARQPADTVKATAGTADEFNREAYNPNTPTPQHKNIKWRLISLLQVELGSKSDPKIKATAEKMIRDIHALADEYEVLGQAWKKCVKVTKITIDEELAETLRHRGEELLAQFNN